MTYQPNFSNVEASQLTLSATGNLATNDYFTLTADHTGITGQSISADTLTLPKGAYLVNASVGLDRTSFNNIFEYQIEVNGSLVGSVGRVDNGLHGDMNVDQAVASFELTASTDIKIKVTDCTSSAWTTQSAYSYLTVIRATR